MDDADRMALECHDSWREFGERFGWTLYGSSYDESASFFMPLESGPSYVNKAQREGIEAALREAERRGMMRGRDIAMAIDSGRGNEAEIARAIESAATEGGE